MTVFPLWAFSTSERTVITRGRTGEEAFSHAVKSFGWCDIVQHDFCPIWAAERYGENHAPGWLTREPIYARKAREAATHYAKNEAFAMGLVADMLLDQYAMSQST